MPLEAIPHKPPFLLLDRILAETDREVLARTVLRRDDELWSRVYAGHYPGNPLTPGVLLCEMMFQAAAVLARRLAPARGLSGAPMLTRIQDVKFRGAVLPGDAIDIRVELTEQLANAFFLRGRVAKDGKTAVEGRFSVALIGPNSGG
jgi:3-hydroxyacyl-[acyl-carrier-protein] dehydratase